MGACVAELVSMRELGSAAYINPFWSAKRALISALAPADCMGRLNTAPTNDFEIGRLRGTRFFKGGTSSAHMARYSTCRYRSE